MFAHKNPHKSFWIECQYFNFCSIKGWLFLVQFCNCFRNTVDFRPKIATPWRWHFFYSTFCRLVVRMTKIYFISPGGGFTWYQKCTKQLAIKKDWELLFLNTYLALVAAKSIPGLPDGEVLPLGVVLGWTPPRWQKWPGKGCKWLLTSSLTIPI